MAKEKTTPTRRKKRVGLILLLILLGLILTVLAAGLILANHYLNKIHHENEYSLIPVESQEFERDDPEWTSEESGQPEESGESGEESAESEDFGLVLEESKYDAGYSFSGGIDGGYNGTEYWYTDRNYNIRKALVPFIDSSGLINILLLGQDGANTGINAHSRADSQILVSINPSTGRVSMISFLRDTYLRIPGYENNRLNVGYRFGGFKLQKAIYEYDFGLSIDGCFCITFTNFEKVIDLLGGIDVNVSHIEAQCFGLSEGMTHINGAQALNIARLRADSNDEVRASRQRKILMAAFEKVRHADVGTLMAILDEVLPYMATDMSNTQIMGIAAQVAPMLGSLSISTYSMPCGGAFRWDWREGMYVVVPDLTKCHEALLEYLPF